MGVFGEGSAFGVGNGHSPYSLGLRRYAICTSMPVSVFENTRDETVTFILEPNGEQYKLPPLARIGVRYSFDPGVDDRTFADFGEHKIRFWCDSTKRDVEIISPNGFDLLLQDICVQHGFCGGIVNDKPAHVTDLLPVSGTVTAEEFARLVIRAEHDGVDHPNKVKRWTEMLKAKFIKHMRASEAPVEALQRNLELPFDGDYR